MHVTHLKPLGGVSASLTHALAGNSHRPHLFHVNIRSTDMFERCKLRLTIQPMTLCLEITSYGEPDIASDPLLHVSEMNLFLPAVTTRGSSIHMDLNKCYIKWELQRAPPSGSCGEKHFNIPVWREVGICSYNPYTPMTTNMAAITASPNVTSHSGLWERWMTEWYIAYYC